MGICYFYMGNIEKVKLNKNNRLHFIMKDV